VAELVTGFTRGAMRDAADRWAARMGEPGPLTDDPETIRDWAVRLHLGQVVTAFAPVGPAASALRRLDGLLAADGIRLIRVLRDEDRIAWPHATHGFFRFKERIPEFLAVTVRSVDRS
jgi:deoxyribodipyrimidine photo-lyase